MSLFAGIPDDEMNSVNLWLEKEYRRKVNRLIIAARESLEFIQTKCCGCGHCCTNYNPDTGIFHEDGKKAKEKLEKVLENMKG